MTKPCRVLHIVGRMDRAGAETMIMNLYREIDRSRFQFDFAYFTEDRCDYDSEIESLGGRIYRIPARGSLSRFVALWRLLREGTWDVVHAHTLFSVGLHLAAARLAGVRQRVAHSHNTQDSNSGSAAGRAYQRAMRRLISWTANSHVACGMAAAEYLFPGRSDVVIVPNAIDIDKFAQASGARVRQELKLPDDCLVILQVGRFMPVKNHVHSVQIAAALRDRGTNFRMLFAGAGPEQHAIEARIDALTLRDHVTILGLRADIDELMAASDVMLMPSLYEGFPVVLVESQAAGLKAVVSNTISSEVDLGLGLVEAVQLDAPAHRWAEAICAASGKERPDQAIRRRALVERGFSSKSGAQMIEKVYSAG